jgi:hypothetical protein
MNSPIAIAAFVAMVDRTDLRLDCKMRVSLFAPPYLVVINASGHLGDSEDDLQGILLP